LGEIPAELIDDRSADRGGPARRALSRAGVKSQYRRSRGGDDQGPEFKPGDRIVHTRFGNGTIVAMSGSPGEEEAIIDFDDLGEKRLVLAYAPLIRA
jgi:DNA helicase-2/ATP-dependent DNA helicase PcrA